MHHCLVRVHWLVRVVLSVRTDRKEERGFDHVEICYRKWGDVSATSVTSRITRYRDISGALPYVSLEVGYARQMLDSAWGQI